MIRKCNHGERVWARCEQCAAEGVYDNFFCNSYAMREAYSQQKRGLFGKYQIFVGDEPRLDESFVGFILRLDRNAERNHQQASKAAIQTYAEAIKEHNPALAVDLKALTDDTAKKGDKCQHGNILYGVCQQCEQEVREIYANSVGVMALKPSDSEKAEPGEDETISADEMYAAKIAETEDSYLKNWVAPTNEISKEEQATLENEVRVDEVMLQAEPGVVRLYSRDLFSPETMHLMQGDIGFAMNAMKAGHKVTRPGWNGKGMFLYYVTANSYPAQSEAVKGIFDDDLVPYSDYIAMKTAQGYVVPWLCSQTDLLANDYQILEDQDSE